MLEEIVDFFVSGFVYPGILWNQLLLAIGLAAVFGAIWLVGYRPPLFKKPWLWVVLAASAILAWGAVAFIQIPLQLWTGQALNSFWSQDTLARWILLASIPGILLTGLVQEGAKLVPVVTLWWRSGKDIDPRLGLVIGAVAGAGLGIFEAIWAHSLTFVHGWSWAAVQLGGFWELSPFWERFFVVAAHIAFSGLAGYGLARGWGWQFYLMASFLHALLNYAVILLGTGVLTAVQVEIYIAVVAVLVTGWALWLRWRQSLELAEAEI